MNPTDLPNYELAQDLLEIKEWQDLLDQRDALRFLIREAEADKKPWSFVSRYYLQEAKIIQRMKQIRRDHERNYPPLEIGQPDDRNRPFYSDEEWDSDWDEPRSTKNEHETFDNRERLNDCHISIRNWRG